ncbi:MAG: hypothetical protein Q8L55_02640 [Phycisphaerales bacterium]|nr:hypothetical protein [Phycisphaerales bacterium]
MQPIAPAQQTPIVGQPAPVNITNNIPPAPSLPLAAVLTAMVGLLGGVGGVLLGHWLSRRKERANRLEARRDKQVDALAQLVASSHLLINACSDYSRLRQQHVTAEYEQLPSTPEDRDYWDELQRVNADLPKREEEFNRAAAVFYILVPPQHRHPSYNVFQVTLASAPEYARDSLTWHLDHAAARYEMLSKFSDKQGTMLREYVVEEAVPWYNFWRKKKESPVSSPPK